MTNFFKDMFLDLLKFIKWVFIGLLGLITVQLLLIAMYLAFKKSCNNDDKLTEQTAKAIGKKVDSFFGYDSEIEKEDSIKHFACVSSKAVPYAILGGNIGMMLGYMSCRCWQGVRTGYAIGATKGEVLGLYVGMIECEPEK